MMTEEEFQDELRIIDKACRQCGAELAQGGLNAFKLHAEAIAAMSAKLKRLEAATAAQRASPALGGCKVPTPETVANANIPSSGDYSDSDVHPGVMCGNGFANTPSSPPDETLKA